MTNESAFRYRYSAPENQEVLNIRKKYMPREESRLEELRRLDRQVQSAGMMASLCAGIGGALVFGVGFCLSMGVLGHSIWPGVLLQLAGAVGMGAAYPLYRSRFKKAKARLTPRILELSAELTGEV